MIDKKLPNVMELIKEAGSGREFFCKCGAKVDHPLGACADCLLVYENKRVAEQLVAARDSIPERFRWATFRPMAAEWSKYASKNDIAAVRSLDLTKDRNIVIVGQSEACKTSLACAVLTSIHRAVTAESPSDLIDKARRTYFVSAQDLARRDFGEEMTERETVAIHRAKYASVLVLDNLEPGKLHDVVGRILMDRHNRNHKVTIVTTWMDENKCAESYGIGLARRIYEKTIVLEGRR
jgi:DNA replication protein DnaC